MYVVYKHTTPSGKVYIGITKRKPEQRWRHNGNGYKDNEHFYRAIKKYGWGNIKHEIVKDGLTKKQACNLEINLIAKYDATNPRNGYNNSTGGEAGSAGRRISEETRRKISAANSGKTSSMKGKHMSAEARRKISEARKGIHLSAETRRKIGAAHKGKHLSAEHRRKIGEAQKGVKRPDYGKHLSAESLRRMSEAHKGQIPRNRKAVFCVETGTLYSSCAEAAKATGVVRQSISKAACGWLKTAGGYHWKYAD